MTYLHANDNVDVNFDGRWGAEPVTRDSLIIQSARLTKLQANSKKSQPTSKSASSGDQSPSSSGGGEKFKHVLENSGANQIAASKVVMEITGLDLADAKEILDNTPIDLKGGLTKADAEKWQKKLQEAGASAKIKAVKTEGDKSPAERLN